MSWLRKLLPLLYAHSPEVYMIVRPKDPPGRPYLIFTASNDLEARETARKVMNGKGAAEVWSGKRLVDIV